MIPAGSRLTCQEAARDHAAPAAFPPPHTGALTMAIEVRIPTILRSYTGGAKSVEGSGATLAELLADLEARHGGLRERLVDDAGLRRFVNVYLNDEDVRFLGGLETPVADGDTVTVLPAVAGGAAAGRSPGVLNAACLVRRDALRLAARLARPHPPGRAAPAVTRRRRPAVGQARGQEPDRLGQGPRRVLHDRAGGEGGPALARLHDPGADLGQHGHLPGHGGQAARLPADLRDAGEHLGRAQAAAGDVRRRDRLLPGGRRLQRGRPGGQAARRRAPGLGDALPVRQRGQCPCALRDHRPRAARRPAGADALRGRPGHHRHPDGRGPVPARAPSRRADRRGRAQVRRAGLRAAQRGRGLRPRAV